MWRRKRRDERIKEHSTQILFSHFCNNNKKSEWALGKDRKNKESKWQKTYPANSHQLIGNAKPHKATHAIVKVENVHDRLQEKASGQPSSCLREI